MRNERRILVNTGAFALGEAVGQLANFAFLALFARLFGAAMLAQYSIGMSVGALLALFVDLGSVGLVTRESARRRGHARMLIGTLLPLQLPLALLLWGIGILVGAALLGRQPGLAVLASACGYQILVSIVGLILAPFIATEQFGWSALAGAAHRVLALSLGALAVLAGAGPGLTSASLLVSIGAVLLGGLALFARHFGMPRWRASPRRAAAILYRGSAFFGLKMLNVVYSRAGLIILGALASPVTVGLFAVADRIIVAPSLLPIMFVNAVYPALSRLANVSADEVRALTIRCGRLLLLGTIPLATLLTLTASEIVEWLFGRRFGPAAVVLQIFAWSLPIASTRQLLGAQLLALDRGTALVRTRAVGVSVLLVSCPMLILSGAGFKGPAWALLIAESLELAACLALLRRSGIPRALARTMLAPLLAAAATFAIAATVWIPAPGLGRSLILCVVMLLALLLSGSVRAHDLRFLRQILARD
jgi:O-antigen/teichoic acid export membrane protein